MKIEKSNNSLPPSAASESAARVAQAKTAQSQPPQDGVNVSLSSNSQLRSMEASIANTPTVDAKRVAELKQAISEGRFQINSEAIADGLINNVEDMINASQS